MLYSAAKGTMTTNDRLRRTVLPRRRLLPFGHLGSTIHRDRLTYVTGMDGCSCKDLDRRCCITPMDWSEVRRARRVKQLHSPKIACPHSVSTLHIFSGQLQIAIRRYQHVLEFVLGTNQVTKLLVARHL